MARRLRTTPAGRSRSRDADLVLDSNEASLLDIVDNVLTRGVVLSGDLTIALAQVDLIYARLSLLLCAADRVLPSENADLVERHRDRRQRRQVAHSRPRADGRSRRGSR